MLNIMVVTSVHEATVHNYFESMFFHIYVNNRRLHQTVSYYFTHPIHVFITIIFIFYFIIQM